MPSKNDLKDFSPIKRRELLISLFLFLMTFAVYLQVYQYDFINYDDNDYITSNSHVQDGITLDTLIWSFTTFHANNWHPLTWLSHMIDCQFFGLNPSGHHLTNLFFHIANTLLLFFVFRKMTGSLWRSAFIAVLFALHPINVESVAWVSERKNVLSAFFWLLTIWCYTRYVSKPDIYRYLLVILFFAFGLMSKPILVTLPCLLLLLDFWPLCRSRFKSSGDNSKTQQNLTARHLVLEKLPLFFLVVISICVTIYAQKQGGALGPLDTFPLNVRMANALVSYVNYIGKMIYPFKLAVLYPYSKIFPLWKIAGAALMLLSISFLAIKTLKERPYFIVGWLWFLGILVPVIGLVQVGIQSMADRYAYVPFIGLFIIIAWGVPDLMEQCRQKKIWIAASATVTISIFTVITWNQVGYWKNSITLFGHALQVTSNNYIAHNNSGNVLINQGRTDEAIQHYLKALRIKPDYVDAHNNLGNVLINQGRTDKAIQHYLQALRINPDYEKAHNNIGNVLLDQGRTDEAIQHYLQALRINPDYAGARSNLGVALFRKGVALFRRRDVDGAISCLREAVRLNPYDKNLQNNLNKALLIQKQNK